MIRHPFTHSDFKDKRLSERANYVLSAMTSTGSSVINRIFRTFAEKIAAYRMINNKKITCASISESYKNASKQAVESNDIAHVLCL